MNISQYAITLSYKKKIILANRLTGDWLRMSEEIYQYLMKAIELDYSEKEFKNAFLDKEDQNYIGQMLYELNRKGLIGEPLMEDRNKITIEITNRCNLNCKHCCISANRFQDELSKEEVTELFDKIIAWKPAKIVITGGEPLVRKDIYELLRYLRSNYSGNIVLATNGVLLCEARITEIIECVDQIDISMDGVDEESCSKIRGKGVFLKILENIALLKKYNFRNITLSMIEIKKNESLIERFLELNGQLGTRPMIRRMAWIGRALENRNTFADDSSIYLNRDEISKDLCSYFNCQMIRSKYHIRFDGNIYACQTMDQNEICNIKEIQTLDEIKDNKLQHVIDSLLEQNEPCRACQVMPFCWKCPIEIQEYTNNGVMKEYCANVKKGFFHAVWEE